MLWMMFTIFAKKIEHWFLSAVDMQRKKDPNLASILVHSEWGFYKEIWHLEANAEQQTTVNDLIEKIKKFLVIMSLMG